jgi:hypothetical protein
VSSNFGYIETIKGRDENNRSSRVINRADGSVHGHVWLPTGECAAFIVDNERVYVGVDRNVDAHGRRPAASSAARPAGREHISRTAHPPIRAE